MPAGHLKLGRKGEDLAGKFLRSKGYAIVERNWRGTRGELDIIAQKKGTLIFVEVKTRSGTKRGLPHDGLTPAKRANLLRTASEYLSREDLWERPCRFDLVAVVEEDGVVRLEHVENAFGPEGGDNAWQPW